MQANTALTSAYSDSIYIFICFLVFFWLFKAIRRFYRTLLLRQAYNTESIVQISGLGSYLSYFDGATSSHLHSIVHTRQTKPPVDMSMMLVPCSLLKSTLSTDGERSVLELQINVLVPGKVILMSNFNMRKFRIAVANESQRKRNQQHNFFDATNNSSNNNHHNHHHHTNNVHNVSFRDSLFSLDQQSISTLSDTRKYYLTRLADLEVCDRACVKYDCNTGVQTIQFTFIIPRVANGLPPVGTEIPNTQGKKEGKRQRSRDKRDSRDSEAPRVSATDPVQPAAATPATPPVRTGNEIFTIGIAFLPNSTEYSPRLRHNSGDLIRDRESVDKSRSSSRESPGKTSTVIFDRQDASNKETTSAFNGTGFLNFRSYFSLGTSEASSKGTSTKRLVVPVEPDSASNNNYTPNNTDHSGDSTQGNGRQQRFSMSQIAAQTNRRSEVTAASIFTFQFPVNILSLFQDTSSSNASTATNNATSPENLMQIENSSNPVIERSTSRDRTSSPSKRINGGGVYPTKTKEILPKALTLMDKNGRIFNSLEIFGLGSLNEGGSNVTVGSPMDTSSLDDPTATNKLSAVKGPETAPSHKERSSVGRSVSNDSEHYRPNSVRPTTSADADLEAGRANNEENNTNNNEEAAATPSVPITPSTSAIFQGGKFTKEECVVCLTDPKNVVLIPCRHLCVCSSCLTYVDKCPVCRAFFEEYVVINYDNSISVSAP